MFGRLARVLVAASDLLEAEGRALRESVFATAMAITLLLLSVGIVLFGVVMLALGVFWGLSAALGQAGAAALAGGVAVLLGLGVMWLAASTSRMQMRAVQRRHARRRSRRDDGSRDVSEGRER